MLGGFFFYTRIGNTPKSYIASYFPAFLYALRLKTVPHFSESSIFKIRKLDFLPLPAAF